MNRQSAFSYVCNACGRCCRDKVITLSPHDVLTIARAAGISTRDAIARFTLRRGSILRFADDGACVALDGARCGLHRGRPLACRLYPLGIERDADGNGERFVQLEPAPRSAGIYGTDGTVADFLEAQGVTTCLAMNDRYRPLIATFRDRIAALADFEKIEPREFWRRATREALAESNYDANPLIDAMFDADRFALSNQEIDETVAAHVAALADMSRQSRDPAAIAAAAVLLAVSLGYLPSAAMES
ncbi:MAG: YkgJ family cysteine cluster protein [Candidatus Binataceae bacterium]